MIGKVNAVVIDCTQPRILATFWSKVLGGVLFGRDDAWWDLLPPDRTRLSFQKVREVKTVKNRLHLDVIVDDVHDATTRAEMIGAQRAGGIQHDDAGTFQVLLDPEGNEWCVVAPAGRTDP